MTYTIKEVADLAGVSTRTLRYYDEIGLLAPTQIGENGYRYYDLDSLLRLQQILIYRQLQVPLKDIQRMMSQPDFELLQALEGHRAALSRQAQRLGTLIETVDQTIATLKGEWIMQDQDYFEGFDETQYEEEVKQRWGDTPQYAESQKKWGAYSKAEQEAIKAEARDFSLRMVGNAHTAPDDADVQAAIGEYHAYINKYFYTCDVNFMRGLADMWVTDPRFAQNYERIRPGGAAFVRQAVHIFCDRNG
jgi:DNA-binding transcriptional MerR regulator